MSPNCKICGSPCDVFAVTDINKTCLPVGSYPFGLEGTAVYYNRCRQCEFIFTNYFDTWSNKEWSNRIYNDQYVVADPEFLISRPQQLANWLLCTMTQALNGTTILDFGSGNGRTERFLHDGGFEQVSSYDPIYHPEFPSSTFDVVTAFEVVEHSSNPIDIFRKMAGLTSRFGLIVIRTCMTPDNIADIRESWWYMAPRNGHVSLYSLKSLNVVASINRMRFQTDGISSFLYRPELITEGSGRELKIAEAFIGWRDHASAYSVIAEGAWHRPEEVQHTGNIFRWSASIDSSKMLVVMPEGFTGEYQINIRCLLLMTGLDDFQVRLIPGADYDLISSSSDDRSHTFWIVAFGARTLQFLISTSVLATPNNNEDRRQLGAAILRPEVRYVGQTVMR